MNTLRSAIPRSVPVPLSAVNSLGIEALGLLAKMLAKPEGWKFYRSALRREIDVGEEKLSRILNELKARGWLSIKSRGGTERGFEWIIHEPRDAERYRATGKAVAKQPQPNAAPNLDEELPIEVEDWLNTLGAERVAWEFAYRQKLPAAIERFEDWFNAPKPKEAPPQSKPDDDDESGLIAFIVQQQKPRNPHGYAAKIKKLIGENAFLGLGQYRAAYAREKTVKLINKYAREVLAAKDSTGRPLRFDPESAYWDEGDFYCYFEGTPARVSPENLAEIKKASIAQKGKTDDD